jgi:hypothetical protein
MAATFISNLIRYKQEHYKPDRDLIVVLETDEEAGDPTQYGIGWLVENHRDLIDAEFALNEGGLSCPSCPREHRIAYICATPVLRRTATPGWRMTSSTCAHTGRMSA